MLVTVAFLVGIGAFAGLFFYCMDNEKFILILIAIILIFCTVIIAFDVARGYLAQGPKRLNTGNTYELLAFAKLPRNISNKDGDNNSYAVIIYEKTSGDTLALKFSELPPKTFMVEIRENKRFFIPVLK